jgi:hypothetical protein
MDATPATTKTEKTPGTLISFEDAAKLLPKPTDKSTVWRWTRDGVKVGEQTIRLATISVGIRIYTSAEYLSEFQAAIDAARANLGNGDQPR